MKTIINLLKQDPRISGYKINRTEKDSYELFFVRGKLETVRSTSTCDREVTVYADHGGFRGDARFFVYPSTTEAELESKISEAAGNALLIDNQPYELPAAEQSEEQVPGNLSEKPFPELAAEIARLIFDANKTENGSLNSVEIFLNRYTDTVCNSRGLHKVQHRCTAMAEAIPTYNGEKQSVELYEQYNFSSLDPTALTREISEKMQEVQARYEAVKPSEPLSCPVVLNRLELSDLFSSIAGELNYSTVYSGENMFSRGDRIQKKVAGDPITLRMEGAVPGCTGSACFDSDGLSLTGIDLVKEGTAVNYYGSSRYGQYLGETPTGNLRCLRVQPGTLENADLEKGSYLEILSMSGLQVSFYNDYIGGEIRLAYLHTGNTVQPITGISVAGKLQNVLDTIRLSRETAVCGNYTGPARALLSGMQIF